MTETVIHRTLKELAAVWLRGRRCTEIAMEVQVNDGASNLYRADVLGAAPLYSHYDWDVRQVVPPLRPFEIFCLEVKVSRADFERGFVSSGCNKHYLVTPPNMLQRSELPSHVGLIEQDPQHYQIARFNTGSWVPTMKVVKKAKKQDIEPYWIQRHRESIAVAGTTSLIATIVEKHFPKAETASTPERYINELKTRIRFRDSDHPLRISHNNLHNPLTRKEQPRQLDSSGETPWRS